VGDLLRLGRALQPPRAGAINIIIPKQSMLSPTYPAAVVAGNPGCALQIAAHSGQRLPVYHPVEVLDASISGRSLP